MVSQPEIQSFGSLAEADESARGEYSMMTLEQRMVILEQLRVQAYSDGQTAPRTSWSS